MVFYVGSVFVIGLIVSPDNPDLLNGSGTAASPWVIAIQTAGIPALPSIINAVVLTSAFVRPPRHDAELTRVVRRKL